MAEERKKELSRHLWKSSPNSPNTCTELKICHFYLNSKNYIAYFFPWFKIITNTTQKIKGYLISKYKSFDHALIVCFQVRIVHQISRPSREEEGTRSPYLLSVDNQIQESLVVIWNFELMILADFGVICLWIMGVEENEWTWVLFKIIYSKGWIWDLDFCLC